MLTGGVALLGFSLAATACPSAPCGLRATIKGGLGPRESAPSAVGERLVAGGFWCPA